jgi:hypothetical protein
MTGPLMSALFGTQAALCAIVARPDAVSTSVATGNQNVGLLSSNSSAQAIGMYLKNAARTYLVWNHDGATPITVAMPLEAAWGSWHIFLMWHGLVNLVQTVEDPFNLNFSAAGATAGLGTVTALGRNYLGAGASYFQGGIGEVLCYNVVPTVDNIARIVNYLRARWAPFGTALLSVPTGDTLETVRDITSRRLVSNMEIHPTYSIPELPLLAASHDLLEDIVVSHPLIPTTDGLGSGNQLWSSRPVRVLKSKLDLDNLKVDIEAIDLRPRIMTYFESGIPLKTSSAERAGVAILQSPGNASGRPFRTYVRNQTGYAIRQNDGAIEAVNANAERVDANGLISETILTNNFIRSSFVSGSTGWTLVAPGTGTNAVETTAGLFMFDSSITTQNLKIDWLTGAAGTAARATGGAAVSLTANFCVQFFYRCVGTAKTWTLSRSGAGNLFWNDTTKAWVAADPGNLIPAASVITQFVSRNITGDAAARTYTIKFSSAELGALRIYHIQCGNTTWPNSVLVTDATVIGPTTPETLLINNPTGNRTFNASVGTFIGYVRPFWNSSEVGTRSFSVFQCFYDLNNLFVLSYDGTNSRWAAIARAAGTNYSALLSAAVTNKASFALPGATYNAIPVAMRWTSSVGELGTVLTLSIFIDGVKGTDVTYVAPTESVKSYMYLGNGTSALGAVPAGPFDGYIFGLRFYPIALTDDEIIAKSFSTFTYST